MMAQFLSLNTYISQTLGIKDYEEKLTLIGEWEKRSLYASTFQLCGKVKL